MQRDYFVTFIDGSWCLSSGKGAVGGLIRDAQYRLYFSFTGLHSCRDSFDAELAALNFLFTSMKKFDIPIEKDDRLHTFKINVGE